MSALNSVASINTVTSPLSPVLTYGVRDIIISRIHQRIYKTACVFDTARHRQKIKTDEALREKACKQQSQTKQGLLVKVN